MSFRRRRVVTNQTCSMTGNPKRPWRTVLRVTDGERVRVDEPVSYNASPGLKYKPRPKREQPSPQMLDLLSTMTAVRLGIPLSYRGRAILQMFYQFAKGS